MSQVIYSNSFSFTGNTSTTIVAANNFALTDLEIVIHAFNPTAAGQADCQLVLSSGGLTNIETMFPFLIAGAAGLVGVSQWGAMQCRRTFPSALVLAPGLDLRLVTTSFLNLTSFNGYINISGFINI